MILVKYLDDLLHHEEAPLLKKMTNRKEYIELGAFGVRRIYLGLMIMSQESHNIHS